MIKLPCACPGSPEIVDGGGKDGRRPLGCGLENRSPCPRGGSVRKGCPALQSGEFHFLATGCIDIIGTPLPYNEFSDGT